MSSVVNVFQDRQQAVDEEPYSQIEWTEDSSSSGSSHYKKRKKERKDAENKKEEEYENQLDKKRQTVKVETLIMQTNSAVEKAQERDLEFSQKAKKRRSATTQKINKVSKTSLSGSNNIGDKRRSMFQSKRSTTEFVKGTTLAGMDSTFESKIGGYSADSPVMMNEKSIPKLGQINIQQRSSFKKIILSSLNKEKAMKIDKKIDFIIPAGNVASQIMASAMN